MSGLPVANPEQESDKPKSQAPDSPTASQGKGVFFPCPGEQPPDYVPFWAARQKSASGSSTILRGDFLGFFR